MSDLFKNIERSLYTFGISNMVEICYDKASITNKLSVNDEEQARFRNCLDKYLKSMQIVKMVAQSKVEEMINSEM